MSTAESPYIEKKTYLSRFAHARELAFREADDHLRTEFGSETEWLRCVKEEFPKYLPFLCKTCKLEFRGRILEIGAGAAWLSAELSKLPNVVEVVATDFSPKLLKEQAPKIFKLLNARAGKITRMPADFHRLDFPNNHFDFVVCSAVLHHAVSMGLVLREMKRVLKPGGQIVAIREPVWPLMKLKSRSKTQTKLVNAGVNEHFYTLTEYREFFAQAGLKLDARRVNLSRGMKYFFNQVVNGLTHARYAFVATKKEQGMIVLGLGGAVGHDPAAALVVDGKVVAAAEEERFLRDKHAKGKQAELAAQFCLKFAGLKPADVQVVAYPFAPVSIFGPARWHYAARHWYAPDRAFAALFNGNRRFRRNMRAVFAALERLGIDRGKVKFIPVEHHLAHASSGYHVSGYKDAAIMSVDGVGEYCTTWFGYGQGGEIHRLKEFFAPDSLGGCYGAITEFLGFEMLDGEFKVMGMAPYGDAKRIDVSKLIQWDEHGFRVNTRLVNCVGWRRYKRPAKGAPEGIGTYFSPELIKMWGLAREGDEIDDPYVHIAAAIQKQLEEILLALTKHFLGDYIAQTKRLCYAGGVALNVKANQRLIQMMGPGHELFVQPAASDAGTALGAATYAAHQLGDTIQPMQHAYLGPEYTPEEIEAVLKKRNLRYEKCASITDTASELLAKGEVVAWFQGRMEFGPRSLGNRSILGNPASRGVADMINAQIKYRERWRPFCPSMLDTVAPEILQATHPTPYMTFTFDVADRWKARIPEVVHEDGTARPQIVTPQSNPRYYELLKKFEARTGIGVLLNTSLNRRGEPMVCSPDDALNMFYGSDLRNLALGDFLVHK